MGGRHKVGFREPPLLPGTVRLIAPPEGGPVSDLPRPPRCHLTLSTYLEVAASAGTVSPIEGQVDPAHFTLPHCVHLRGRRPSGSIASLHMLHVQPASNRPWPRPLLSKKEGKAGGEGVGCVDGCVHELRSWWR